MTSLLDDAKQTLNDIQQGLSNVGFDLLGMAAPLLSIRWTAGSDPTEPQGGAGLSLTAGEPWAAPAPGVLTVNGGAGRILLPSGQPPTGSVSVLRLHPQVYLRLQRLYASFIEGRTDGLDLTLRPVPLYFVYTPPGSPSGASGATSGPVKPGDSLKLAGTLTVHDRHGLPIDPVAVAGVFDALLTGFPTLEPKAGLSSPPTPPAGRQLNRIAALGAAGKRLRLADPHGKPHDGTLLQNLTALAASSGLFTTTGAAITKATGAPPDLRLGPATNGLLGESFTLPAAPAGAPSLRRDFFSVMVVDVKPFLIGTPDPAPGNPAAPLEPPPEVRHQEAVTFALDGAMALGGANKLLGQTPPLTDAFAVAPAMQGDFALPADGLEATAHWPAFPPNLPAANDPIPGTLRAAFAPSARFVSGSGTGADVQLTLNGLTAGQAVRVYNRVFLPDAREGRGDGAGAVVGGTAGTKGSMTVRLKDPLGIVERGQAPTIPTEATLHVDVVVVNSKGAARVFGNVTAPIQAPAPATLPALGSNPFGSTTIDRGTAPAGLLGLTTQPLPSVANGPLAVVLALSGEGSPREAPRVPTMARREAIVASASGTGIARAWKGQLSGAHLVPGAINSRHREGSPGSPGGRELQTVAVETVGGRLAYDLARAAVRRTRHLLPRLILTENDRWAPPAAATGGTISGAVLQTIGAGAETPELTAFRSKLSGPDFPQTWAQVVDKVFDKLPDMPEIPKPLPNFLVDAIKKIHDDLVNSPNHVRMYEEFKRDCSATFHGRRDALWALTRALGAARELIYIEGPAFSATGYAAPSGGPVVPTDLVETIKARLRAVPGLRVVLCLSKELDYGPGYEMLAAREYAQRLAAVKRLQDEAGSRVVAFHPIGFPGRPLRLMTNVVVVDDLWALVGTSAFRRRGLTFDGGLDVSLFDSTIRDGRGAAIATLRRRLMAGHLGVAAPLPPAAGAPVPVPHPTWVRLADAHSAFSAVQDLLRQGGAGLIEPLWDGRVPGVEPIDPTKTPFGADSVADPDGRDFNSFVGLILGAFASASTTAPSP